MIEDLRRVHPARRAPHHLARLPIEYRGRPPVLIFESLPARLEVDHHPVHIVLMELSHHLIFLERTNHLYFIVLEQRRRRSRWDGGQNGAQSEQCSMPGNLHEGEDSLWFIEAQ